MEAIAIWLLVLGYAFGACLMLAFWSRIPPPQFFQDLLETSPLRVVGKAQ